MFKDSEHLLNTMTCFSRAASEQVSTQPVLVHAVFFPQVQDPALVLDEFQKVLLWTSLQPVKILPNGSTTFCSIGHFWIQYLRLGDTTGLQLDPVTLIRTLWDLPYSLFSIHLIIWSSSSHFLSLPIRMSCQTVSKAWLKPKKTTFTVLPSFIQPVIPL